MEIKQISIHIEEILPITASSPALLRFSQKVKQLVFKYLPKTSSPEMSFKTTLALLLAQEGVRTYLLQEGSRRDDFFSALSQAALECGFHAFSLPNSNDPWQISQELTKLEGHKLSLVEDMAELSLQNASLSPSERQNILSSIFDRLERPPILSVMEIKTPDTTQSIPLTTQYAQYKVINHHSGEIRYSYLANRATSSIRTLHNSLPDGKGTMNQRTVRSTDTKAWIGTYCGELSTPRHVLEQLLLIAGQTSGEAIVVDHVPQEFHIQDLPILFTSLYSWYELSLITDQRAAVNLWDGKILFSEGTYYQLRLFHYNIPFNGSNHLPTPGEIGATMQDMNDTAWIPLTAHFFQSLHIEVEALTAIAARVDSLKSLGDQHFLEREAALLEEIDAFRKLMPSLMKALDQHPQDPFITTLKMLYNKKLAGMDKLLYLDHAIKALGFFHNKNSRNATDRIAGAVAADKAQYAFQILENKPFLPQAASTDEREMFKNLYSIYLLKEEPELNAAFSSGFRKHVHQNPETKLYLQNIKTDKMARSKRLETEH